MMLESGQKKPWKKKQRKYNNLYTLW
jgi:hypothetical protein